jgi:hypothetical protein
MGQRKPEMLSYPHVKRMRKGAPISERLEHYSMPVTECGCQIWFGSTNGYGYGNLHFEDGVKLAHRLAWSEKNGPIPEGMLVCHQCDIPACINPDHLFLGTKKDNSDDKVSKNRQSRTRGEKAGTAKLTAAEVLQIWAASGLHREIAEQFGVHKSCVSLIKSRKNWAHLDDHRVGYL